MTVLHRLRDADPFELYGLVLCIVVGVPVITGEARPGSISALLPASWMVTLWGVTLALGALTALTGIVWRDRITGIIFEQIGLTATGVATLFYAFCVLEANWRMGLAAAGLVSAFGMACIAQWAKLAVLLKRVERIQDENKRG